MILYTGTELVVLFYLQYLQNSCNGNNRQIASITKPISLALLGVRDKTLKLPVWHDVYPFVMNGLIKPCLSSYNMIKRNALFDKDPQ